MMPKTAEEIALQLITAVDITALPRDETERDQRVKELVATAYAVADVMTDAIASTQAARETARLGSDPVTPEKARRVMKEHFNPDFVFKPSEGSEPK